MNSEVCVEVSYVRLVLKYPLLALALARPLLLVTCSWWFNNTFLIFAARASILYNYAYHFITMWERGRGIYINNVTLCAYQGYALLPPVWQYIDGDYMGS